MILLWVFVAIVVIVALYLAYKDISKNITQEEKRKRVEKFDEPKLKVCLFYANWCGHCAKYLKQNTFMDTYNQLKQQNEFDKVVFVQYDFDKNKDLANKYNISSFPSIVAISSDGYLVNEFNGNRNDPNELTQFTVESLNKV